jgi:hypothetical protein
LAVWLGAQHQLGPRAGPGPMRPTSSSQCPPTSIHDRATPRPDRDTLAQSDPLTTIRLAGRLPQLCRELGGFTQGLIPLRPESRQPQQEGKKKKTEGKKDSKTPSLLTLRPTRLVRVTPSQFVLSFQLQLCLFTSRLLPRRLEADPGVPTSPLRATFQIATNHECTNPDA